MQRSVSCFLTMSLVLFGALTLAAAAPNQKENADEQAMQEQMAMMEQMDLMSKMEMQGHLDAAKSYAQQNNFSGASERLALARKLATDNSSRTQIATAESYVSTQQSRYAEEKRKKDIEDTYQNAVAAGEQKDYAKAFPLFADAAGKGHAKAYRMLGGYTAYGLATTQDIKLADTYFAKATELGDTGAAESREKVYQDLTQRLAKAQASGNSGYSGGSRSYNSSSSNSPSSSYTSPAYSEPAASSRSIERSVNNTFNEGIKSVERHERQRLN